MVYQGSFDSFQRLLERISRLVPDLNNMELTNCLWALATLEATDAAETALLTQLAAPWRHPFPALITFTILSNT